MIKLALCAQMRSIDKAAIEEFKIPGIVLMENAALSIFQICKELDAYAPKKVLILCGTGNNGGDGFALARHMHNDGADVLIILAGEPDKIKADAEINYNICISLGIDIRTWNGELPEYPLIIDAILGTGVKGELRGKLADIILAVNNSSAFVLAVDCPTGGNPDTGQVLTCIHANITATLTLVKPGLLLYPLAEYTGKLLLCGPVLLNNHDTGIYALDTHSAAKLLPKRWARSHKGSYGRVVILAGSTGMAGAAAFCALAAYNSGCGYVEICTPPGVISIVQQLAPQAIATVLPELEGLAFEGAVQSALEKINNAKVCLIGPGLGNKPGVAEFVKAVIQNSKTPLLIDADALNVISPEVLDTAASEIVITPHPLEFSRLSGLDLEYILNNMPKVAAEFAKAHRVTVVLKDASTVIAGDNRLFINKSGCSALAKAGSGDLLAGIISGLMAQGLEALEAAALGVFIHGRSGIAAANKYGSYSVGSRELLDSFHEVFRELESVDIC